MHYSSTGVLFARRRCRWRISRRVREPGRNSAGSGYSRDFARFCSSPPHSSHRPGCVRALTISPHWRHSYSDSMADVSCSISWPRGMNRRMGPRPKSINNNRYIMTFVFDPARLFSARARIDGVRGMGTSDGRPRELCPLSSEPFRSAPGGTRSCRHPNGFPTGPAPADYVRRFGAGREHSAH